MKKHRNTVRDHTEAFTPRQWRHFIDHGPNWRYHYQKENRQRLKFGLLLALVVFATVAVIYMETHIIE